jgi:hypothetical protein
MSSPILRPLRSVGSKLKQQLNLRTARLQHNQELLERHHQLLALHDKIDEMGILHIFGDVPTDWSPFLRFAGPGHFYSPIPRLSEVEESFPAVQAAASNLVGIDLREADQLELLRTLAPIGRDWSFPAERTEGFRYFSGPGNFAFGLSDSIILHSMLRHFRPKRLVEVGSGFSSALTLDTNDRYLDGSIDVTFIEPYPELLLSLIGDEGSGATVLDEFVQTVDTSLFSQLEPNDILFLDTSHVSRFGSDVNDLFTRVIPSVAPGVIIHIHDIFWPFEYPLEWLREGRAWNEVYVLRAFLQFNEQFEILLFNSWLDLHHRDLIAAEIPRMLEGGGGSIWLRRVS